MPASEVYKFYQDLASDKFVLIYLGVFDDNLTTILLDINEASKSEMKASRKKMSFLIAECFQNIIRHAEKSGNKVYQDYPEMFLLRDKGSVHQLITSNLVDGDTKNLLNKNLNSLKELNSEELKELYLHAFQNNTHSEKGGAGLGLIEMARKSGIPPSFEFIEVEQGMYNFIMQVNVIAKNYYGDITAETTSLDSAIGIYNRVLREKIVLVQKGDFSQEAVMPLIQLFENNLTLQAEHITTLKKVIYLLIEMLQNITRHGEKVNEIKEGIFYVSKTDDNSYQINTGNFVTHEMGVKLSTQLSNIVSLDKIELTKLYKQQLMNTEEVEGKGAGIGLIEICRHSSDGINYEILELNSTLSFFGFSVKV